MKKTFRFLALSLALICGTLSSLAAETPNVGTIVGTTVDGGLVYYKVNGAKTDQGYPLTIIGLNYQALQKLGKENITLNIKTSFNEDLGDSNYNYYVTKIDEGFDGVTAQSFNGYEEIVSLTFADDPSVARPGAGKTGHGMEVGEAAFYGCTNLASLTLPDFTTKIGDKAFQRTSIVNFTIPAECGTIGKLAFYNCTKLNEVKVADAGNTALTVLDQQVFANSSLKTLDLTKATKLATLGATTGSPFIYELSAINNQLQTIKLPASVKTVNKSFAKLTGLTSIEGLENTAIEEFDDKAFEGDESLTTLNLPKGASTKVLLNGTPFVGCKKLATLTFAAGFLGTIGDAAQNVYGTNEEDLAALKKIIFNGDVYGVIADNSFVGCTALEEVEFKGALSSYVDPAAVPAIAQTAVINAAFTNVTSLTKLTFSGDYSIFTPWNATATAPAVQIAANAFKGTKITALDFKKMNVQKGSATIAAAFDVDVLASVKFGDITLGNADNPATSANEASVGTLTLNDDAFKSPVLTTAEFAKITAVNGASIFTIGDGLGQVFNTVDASGNYALTTVKFGAIVGGADVNTINDYAFYSEALETIEIAKDANISALSGGSIKIGLSAFQGGKANEKSVTIGNLKATTTIGNLAFNGDMLANVKIGDISANVTIGNTGTVVTAPFGGDKAEKTIEIGAINNAITDFTLDIKDFAFAGRTKSVKIGNIGNGNTTATDHATVTIGQNAFAFTPSTDETASSETIEFGFLDAKALTIKAGAFIGPDYYVDADNQGFGTYNVTIGDIFAAPTSIKSGAFGAGSSTSLSQMGKTTYNIGNVKADVTGVDAYAFNGSYSDNSFAKTNASVTIKDIEYAFQNGAFGAVYDVTTGKWAIAGDLSQFNGVVEATVGAIPTGKSIAGTAANLESITFTGSVADNQSIKDFTSSKVRTINFKNVKNADVSVAYQAVKAGAFTAATTAAAAAKENINVIYREEQNRESYVIFEQEAFATAKGDPVVILYTTEWVKANKYEAADLADANKQAVYRLGYSAANVAPGEPIEVTCIAQTGGKNAYGRLYIPSSKNGYYKVFANKVDGKNTVNLYYGNNDGTSSDIYMIQVPIVNGYYFIDATEVEHAFVVRTSDLENLTVTAEPATEEDIQMIADDPDYNWFDASDAKWNALNIAAEEVPNQELQNNVEFMNKSIYVMANPAKYGLAFGQLNQYTTSKNLAKNALYVVVKNLAPSKAARSLNVIWDDEDAENNTTAIEAVENITNEDGVIYNLQGVRVNGAQKGIFIKNGKKYVK